MKLLDILARDLKVWPEGFGNAVGQSNKGRLHPALGAVKHMDPAFELAEDWPTAVVTVCEWKDAATAQKAAAALPGVVQLPGGMDGAVYAVVPAVAAVEAVEPAKGMREQFEAYRDKRNAELEKEGHKPGSKWHVTNAHYPTWQASRVAVVVHIDLENWPGSMAREIQAAIEAAGLKVAR